ncbi:MAG: peptidoglycan-binding protein [Deltaproteobacteria bacterium]|nr:peptidoglycan-binding protein [Deltaproteobacteria bacterium]
MGDAGYAHCDRRSGGKPVRGIAAAATPSWRRERGIGDPTRHARWHEFATVTETPCMRNSPLPRSPRGATGRARWSAGILCREDGLIFHPDMLLASTPKEHRAEMAVVVDMLKRVGRAEGVKVDLGSEPARRALAAELASLDPVKRRQVEALLAQALRSSAVGYYGDLDYLEEIDATTGKRVPLGSIDKNDRASAAAKANLRRTGVAITPRLPGDEGPLEDHSSLGQHGSAAEVVDPATGLLKFAHIGDIIVALPDGKLVKIPYPPAPEGLTGDEAVRAQDAALRQTLEEYVRRYTGPAHLSADDRHVDAQTADPDVPPPPPRAPRLTAKTAGALPRSDLEITETPSERGTPASRLDLHASLVARGLVLIHPDNGKFFEGLIDPVDLAALAATLARESVVAGVDAERRAIVVVTHDDHGVADALKRLGGAHVALQRARVGLRRWWEIVAPIYLASWGGIAGVLPDEPGDLATASDARTADLSSAHPPKGYTLKRFRAIRGRRSYAARGDRALAVRLENVWERSRDHAFKFLATTIGGRDVLLFRAPPARHDDETAGAVVAPQWVFDYDLRTTEGLSRALVALGWLEPAESADPAAIQEKVRRFQASTMKLRVDGVVGRKTRAALRAALAEVEGDGIVESEAP